MKSKRFCHTYETLLVASLCFSTKYVNHKWIIDAQTQRYAINCVKPTCILIHILRKVLIYKNIRIRHECEGGIEKFVPWINDWHHKACQLMTNGDQEGQIIYFHPQTNNRSFSCSPIRTTFYIGKREKGLKKILTWLRRNMVT